MIRVRCRGYEGTLLKVEEGVVQYFDNKPLLTYYNVEIKLRKGEKLTIENVVETEIGFSNS